MKKNQGFGITEFIVAIAISVVLVILATAFARDLFVFNFSSQSKMTALLESRKVLKTMVSELRSAIPSAQGSYTIESASASSIVFFADVNLDEIADRVRYFYDAPTRSVRRGVVLASGNPPAYSLPSESFSTLITNVSSDPSVPLFKYYNGSYSVLPSPIEITNVRLIEITAKIQWSPVRFPLEVMTITSQATLRNLKDNL